MTDSKKMKLYAGGTLSPGEHYYVERPEDRTLYKLCQEGEYCYILAARQLGKSSLAANVILKLEQENIRSLYVDLQGIGKQTVERDNLYEQASDARLQKVGTDSQKLDALADTRKPLFVSSYQDKWYLSLLNAILNECREIRKEVNLDEWWASRPGFDNIQKLTAFFEEIILARISQRVVVFFDEIDRFPEKILSDDFFMALRKMHNDRFNNAEFKRLSFVIIGHRLPRTLIQDKSISPFNIGTRLDLEDLQIDRAVILTNNIKLGPEISPRQVIETVFSFTNGHPYMTHEACKYLTDITNDDEDPYHLNTQEQVAQVMEYLIKKTFAEKHLNKIHDWLNAVPNPVAVLRLYGYILEGNDVLFDETIQPLDDLRYSGLIKIVNGLAKVRNRIYSQVFSKDWVIYQLQNKYGAVSPRDFSLGLAGLGIPTSAEIVEPTEKAKSEKVQPMAEAGVEDRVTLDSLRAAFDAERPPVEIKDEKLEVALSRILEEERGRPDRETGGTAIAEWLDRRVSKSSLGDRIARDLARADLKFKVGEYFALILIATVTMGFIGWLLQPNPVAAVSGAGIGFFLPQFYVKRQQSVRLNRFDDQLGDMLNLMVDGLRAGYSTMQTLEAVSRELPSPICDEFRRVVQEMQIGIPMETALDNLLRRIPNEDLDFVVTAMNVQREVGGNLSEILDNASQRLRTQNLDGLQVKRSSFPSFTFFYVSSSIFLTLHSLIFPNSLAALNPNNKFWGAIWFLMLLWSLILIIMGAVRIMRIDLIGEKHLVVWAMLSLAIAYLLGVPDILLIWLLLMLLPWIPFGIYLAGGLWGVAFLYLLAIVFPGVSIAPERLAYIKFVVEKLLMAFSSIPLPKTQFSLPVLDSKTWLIWILLLVLPLAVVALVLWYARCRRILQSKGDPLMDRLVESIERGSLTSLEEIELSQSFSERMFIPIIRRIGEFLDRLTPSKAMQNTQRRLELAGNPWAIDAATFIAIRFILALVLGGLTLGIVSQSPSSVPGANFMYIGGLALAGFYLPHLLLISKIPRRQKEIRNAMPEALDLLTICFEAGLGFDAAISKVSEKWESELSLVFTRMIREIQLGKVRRDALRDMADRLDIPEMTRFAAGIIQSEQLGISLAKALRNESNSIIDARRAEIFAYLSRLEAVCKILLIILYGPVLVFWFLWPLLTQILALG